MTLYEEMTVAVLDAEEDLLGYLNPEYLELEEDEAEQELRRITLTHSLLDDSGLSLGEYGDLLVHGNKIWRPVTGNGDSCLYVLLDDREVDSTMQTVTITAEEVAVELSQIPPVRLSNLLEYYEDWEDGLYGRMYTEPDTVRTLPYRDWLCRGGTPSMESGSPISGSYSLKHRGDNSTSVVNRIQGLWAGVVPEVIRFKFRLTGQGALASTPWVMLWMFRYQDTANYLYLRSMYDSGTGQQTLQIGKVQGGSSSNVANTNWMAGKLPVGTTYDFEITDDGSTIKVYVNGVLKLTGAYTVNFSTNCFGFGAYQDTSALWDEIAFQYRASPEIPTTSVTEEFLEIIAGDLFIIGDVVEGEEFTYAGTVGVMGLLREIEDQTGCEFAFRYEFNEVENRIDRYLDFLSQRGSAHSVPIEVGYNTENITIEENESDVAVAAAPLGDASSKSDSELTKFNIARWEWEQLEVDPLVQIPLWRTKDEDGNWVDGPLVYPPYPKPKNQNYVSSVSVPGEGDSSANYQVVERMKHIMGWLPRTVMFTTSEEDPVNIYWLCVKEIREHIHPSVKVEVNVVDIVKLREGESNPYNVGDTVTVRLPGRSNFITARVVKTVKNPRTPDKDKVELGNVTVDFFADYLGVKRNSREGYSELS